MSISLLYHGFGSKGYDYVNPQYQGGAVTFTVEPKPFSLRCPECRSDKVIRRGTIPRLFRTLPIGGKAVWLLAVQRVECLVCGVLRHAKIGFADPRRSYKVTDFRNKLLSDDNYSTDYEKMIRQLDTYWKKLFADPIAVNTPQGIVFVQPQRTNNILERFFRDFKRSNRKRSGSVSLSKTLKAILSDTPLVKNLENKEYLDIILNGANTLEERFAQIDINIVINQLKEGNKESRNIPIQLKKLIRDPGVDPIGWTA